MDDEIEENTNQLEPTKVRFGDSSSSQPIPAPRPSLMKNAKNASSSAQSSESLNSSNFSQEQPLDDKKRSYTNPISPKRGRRKILPPRERSVDGTLMSGGDFALSTATGNVSIDLRKCELPIGSGNKDHASNSDQLKAINLVESPRTGEEESKDTVNRLPYQRHSLHQQQSNILCLESVGLVFSKADNFYVKKTC